VLTLGKSAEMNVDILIVLFWIAFVCFLIWLFFKFGILVIGFWFDDDC